jgi:hypothetical protein
MLANTLCGESGGKLSVELLAEEEIGRYIEFYNQSQSHQALSNLSFSYVNREPYFRTTSDQDPKSDSLHSSILSH